MAHTRELSGKFLPRSTLPDKNHKIVLIHFSLTRHSIRAVFNPALCVRQSGVRLTHKQTVDLLRPMLSNLCEPASAGTMITNSSPMDPIFWLFHPFFEKGQHVLWMSPKYRDNYSFGWDNGTCLGSNFEDVLPFSGACYSCK